MPPLSPSQVVAVKIIELSAATETNAASSLPSSNPTCNVCELSRLVTLMYLTLVLTTVPALSDVLKLSIVVIHNFCSWMLS